MNFFKKIKSFFRRKKKTDKVPSKKKIAKQNTRKITKSEDQINAGKLSKKTPKKHKVKKAKQPRQGSTAPIDKVTVNIPSTIKVVITGSVGAGKTTAIHAISDTAPITTESAPSDNVKELKDSTTTAMDYGSYKKSGKKVNVYGTPGQKRFSFMSDVLTIGACGLIIMITDNQDEPLEDLDHYLKNNQKFLANNPAIIGITHLDMNSQHDISIYTDFMQKQSTAWPVVAIDARKKSDVFNLIDQLTQAAFSLKFH